MKEASELDPQVRRYLRSKFSTVELATLEVPDLEDQQRNKEGNWVRRTCEGTLNHIQNKVSTRGEELKSAPHRMQAVGDTEF